MQTDSVPLTILMVGSLPVDLRLVKGGVEAVIMNLFEGFRRFEDIRIVHVAFSKETKSEKTISFAPNITIHFIPFANQFELVDYAINTKPLDRIIEREKPDLIHIQEITPQILRFLRFPLDRIVVTQHGVMAEEVKYMNGVTQKMKGLFKAGIERFVFPRFSNIIFISDYNRALFRGNARLQTRIFNPVHPMFLENEPSESGMANNLLYVGVISRRKNIGVVVQALARLKDTYQFKLHVVGGFRDAAYEAEIKALINETGLADHIVFHGWLTQSEIAKLYADSPLFILPSLQETLPVSVAEAMARGRIVIASDVGGIREMFTNGVSGFLFRRNDLDHLTRVLRTVFGRNGDNSIGKRAREEAVQKFHPVSIARETASFYREVFTTKHLAQ